MKKTVLLITISFFISFNSFAQEEVGYELDYINFAGNNFFSDSELLSQIESKETPWWLWKFLNSFTPLGSEKQFLDSGIVPIDVQAIAEYYLTYGFFEANVKSEIEVDTTDKTAGLNFTIKEGLRSSYGEIKFAGLEGLNPGDFKRMLNESITINSTKQYSQPEVQSNISNMLRFLGNNGYLFASYDSTIVTKDTLNSIADVEIHFTIGIKYYVSDVKIYKSGEGAGEITDELIDDIVSIESGDHFEQAKLDRSEIRLLRTGLFNSVSLNPAIKDTFNNTVPIEVVANVTTLNEISPEIKGDNEFSSFNLGLGASVTRKNLFGDARKLTLSTSFRLIDIPNFNFSNLFKSIGNRDSTYQGVFDFELELEQPYLFGRPILTKTRAYYRASTFAAATEVLYGAVQSFDFEMPEYTFITLLRPQVSIEVADYSVRTFGQNFSFDIQSLTPGLGFELGSSKTDNILYPTSGYNLYIFPETFLSQTDLNLRLDTNIVEIKETGYFYKFQASFAQFFTIAKDKNSVLGIKFKTGYIQSINGSYNLVPPNRTFFAGGSNSIRGWRSRELIPKDSVEYLGVLTSNESTQRGGTFLVEGSFEFRRKFAESFGFALFADYGNTWNGYKKISLSQFAVATGFGIRYYSPIAPFRLDFGMKFYNPEDQKIITKKNFWKNLEIHFGIGEAF